MKLYTQILIACLAALLVVDQSEGSCLIGCLRGMLKCSRGATSGQYSKSSCCKPYDDCYFECEGKPNTRKCKFAKRDGMVERRGSWNKRGEESKEDFGLLDGPYFL